MSDPRLDIVQNMSRRDYIAAQAVHALFLLVPNDNLKVVPDLARKFADELCRELDAHPYEQKP